MSVDAFNKLPRSPRAPSGRVPNVWHFDIRFVQLQPPSHTVFLFQPESSFIHMELVPVGQSKGQGFAFFPDTPKEAAGEVAKALIHAFMTSLGTGNEKPYAPWSFTTDDRGLAKEVGAELKRLGVKAPEVCDVKYVPKHTDAAHGRFCEMFKAMKSGMGLQPLVAAAFVAPSGISFSSFKLAQWVQPKSDPSEAALAYSQQLSSARPLSGERDMNELMQEVQVTMEVLKRRPSAVVRSEADAGNPQAALEYALRLQYGIQCTASRPQFREYLMQVILSPKADDTMKSIAHSLMIDWYIKGVFENGAAPARYLHAAAHGADEAIRLAKGAASPAVLFFAFYVLGKHATKIVELNAQYKHVWQAKARRDQEIAKADSKATLKRMKEPNRYMCAHVGCAVSANSGHMLQKCAGKCDEDKKPSYCGKECQRADWKNHKPFCTPGAACSVLERPDIEVHGHSAARAGAIEVPIRNADGTTTLLSSSTMSPKMLKEMKAFAEAGAAGRNGPGFSNGIQVGIGKMRVDDDDDDSDDEVD
ncbi:hypothetical protein B0H15DRAFT_608102 [Mycena belliarum]|uniref:MYND-type domain-containing protein n=1 Tax=Mycena belliarum TaxID=1033014 RepID=A0AAD6TTB5_9AGAR|nr:hypothetical protein B0H15DRAFT_608102 [Mycena belliae]